MAGKDDVAVAELTQAIGMLVRRIRVAGRTQDLSLTESAVLARLDREGPATTADLARAEGVTPQSMGATVAALVKRGMVERREHETDGRQRMVVLTRRGAAVRRQMKEAKHTWLAQAVMRLGKREREQLLAAGSVIRRLAEQ